MDSERNDTNISYINDTDKIIEFCGTELSGEEQNVILQYRQDIFLKILLKHMYSCVHDAMGKS